MKDVSDVSATSTLTSQHSFPSTAWPSGVITPVIIYIVSLATLRGTPLYSFNFVYHRFLLSILDSERTGLTLVSVVCHDASLVFIH